MSACAYLHFNAFILFYSIAYLGDMTTTATGVSLEHVLTILADLDLSSESRLIFSFCLPITCVVAFRFLTWVFD